MVNEGLKCSGVLVVCLSIALAGCGGPAVGVRGDEGPPASQVETSGQMAEATRGATPAVKATAEAESSLVEACTASEPAWVKPPEDAAVADTPGYGYYYVNKDGSMWASAWWTGAEDYGLRAGDEGNKVGWFRPEGATLEITGRRLDAKAPPLDAHVPCCYPTRFQATGLIFPTEGCWEVTAQAEDSRLSFVVWVEP